MTEGVQTSSPIVSKSIAMIPHMILSARLIATDPMLDTYLEDEQYSELMVNLMETLTITSSEKKYSETYLSEMKNIVVQICCNLIKLTKGEAERMKDDPQEYINFSLDCCDK